MVCHDRCNDPKGTNLSPGLTDHGGKDCNANRQSSCISPRCDLVPLNITRRVGPDKLFCCEVPSRPPVHCDRHNDSQGTNLSSGLTDLGGKDCNATLTLSPRKQPAVKCSSRECPLPEEEFPHSHCVRCFDRTCAHDASSGLLM